MTHLNVQALMIVSVMIFLVIMAGFAALEVASRRDQRRFKREREQLRR